MNNYNNTGGDRGGYHSHTPPSYTDITSRSQEYYDGRESYDDNRSYQNSDMYRARSPMDKRAGQYSPFQEYSDSSAPRSDPRNYRPPEDGRRYVPDNDRYPDRGRPTDPYNDRYSDKEPRYNDRRGDPYDDRSDRYYDDGKRYPPRDDSVRDRYDDYDDRPMPRNGHPNYPQPEEDRYYDDRPHNGPGSAFNGSYSQHSYDHRRGDSRDRADLEDVRLDDPTPRYQVKEDGRDPTVELAYRPKTEPVPNKGKKPVLKESKPKMVGEKWRNRPLKERRLYCALIVCLVLMAVTAIVVPMAIYVRLWHKLTWDDIIKLQVEPRTIKWGQNGRYVYYKDFTNNVIRVDLLKKGVIQEIILEFEIWNKVGFDDFDVTGPGSMLILAKNTGESRRHIHFKNLYKYEIGDINNEPEEFKRNVVDWEILSDTYENRIVFTQLDSMGAYNIRVEDMGPSVKTLKEVGVKTNNPRYLRGVLSYLYSEEFYGKSSKGFWTSINGDYIIFMETDMSSVRELSMKNATGKDVKYSYPRPGEPNPVVKLKMYFVTEDKLVDADEPLDPKGKQDKHYITSVSFPNTRKVLIEFMNRQQTRAVTEECVMDLSPTCVDLPILRRESYQSWLPRYSAAAYTASPELDTQQYYVLRPRVDKQFNFTHLHRYTKTNDPEKKEALTNGEFAVTDLIGVDNTRKHVLYVRTEAMNLNKESESITRQRLLYMYNANSDKHTCVSCLEPKNRCNVATANIDSSRQWFIVECLGPSVPYRRIRKFSDLSWNVYTDDNQNMQYENPSLQAQLLQKKSPFVEFTQTELDKNSKMYFAVKKIFPLYYVRHVNILKYPLLIWVNPDPDMNMATEKYKLDLAQWLATKYDCVVIYMDIKGTPGRGLSYHHYGYKNFDKLVTEAVKAIKDIKMYWHVDDGKVAIMGEKMGGWLALKLMTKQPDWFKAVVAVNPILDFKEHISAWSERYLEMYAQNIKGYTNAKITDLGSFDIKKRTVIYYDAINYEVPSTYATLMKDKSSIYNGVTLKDIQKCSDNNSDDLFMRIGQNITTFLKEGGHDIF